jgi:hypothetical protein
MYFIRRFEPSLPQRNGILGHDMDLLASAQIVSSEHRHFLFWNQYVENEYETVSFNFNSDMNALPINGI